MHPTPTILVLLLAVHLHEAAREPAIKAAALDIAVGQAAEFVEFADLNPEIRDLYTATAEHLLKRVEPWCPATDSTPRADAVDWLANHLTVAAHAGGPIRATFESLTSEGQEFRRAQATYLLARFGFRDAPALGARDNGDPARQSPPR